MAIFNKSFSVASLTRAFSFVLRVTKFLSILNSNFVSFRLIDEDGEVWNEKIFSINVDMVLFFIASS
ncbi:hypothetical protein ONA24_03770 [Mycoplasmopsis cynos]|nr:hypothetical protein [Mycoplasmopsis cynos]WAM09212.1 hypothetical protein ONA24_03770 [Mycoplasmopsis cynos]